MQSCKSYAYCVACTYIDDLREDMFVHPFWKEIFYVFQRPK